MGGREQLHRLRTGFLCNISQDGCTSCIRETWSNILFLASGVERSMLDACRALIRKEAGSISDHAHKIFR